MELSTTIPTAKAMPASEMILILRPKIFKTINTDTKLTGILIATINNERAEPRKINNTATARRAPRPRFDFTKCIASSI